MRTLPFTGPRRTLDALHFLQAIFSAVADRAAQGSIDGAFIVLAASIDGFFAATSVLEGKADCPVARSDF